MAGFSAADRLAVPTFDFRPYVDADGTVPEPSLDQIEAYYNAAQAIAVDTGKVWEEIRQDRLDRRRAAWQREHPGGDMPADDDLPPETLIATSERLAEEQTRSGEIQRESLDRQVRALADLCSGTPSYEQLTELAKHIRVFEAFQGYIEGFYSPEARRAALNP